MCKYLDGIRTFLRSEDGPTATEYAVLLMLIGIAIILAVTAFGGAVSTKLNAAAGDVDAL